MTLPPDQRIRDENAVLREMVSVYSELSGLASQDIDLADVIRLVADRIGVSAVVVDADLQVIATASEDGVDNVLDRASTVDGALGRLVATTAKVRRAVSSSSVTNDATSVVVAPVILGNEAAAYLITVSRDDGGQNEDTRLMVTEHAAMICGIVFGRSRVVAAAAGEARRDLFEGLLSLGDRPDAEVDSWARHLGIKPDQSHRVMTVVVGTTTGATVGAANPAASSPETGGADAAALVAHLLSTHCHEATVINRDTEVVAVIPVTAPDPQFLLGLRAVADLFAEGVHSRFAGISVSTGIGNCYPGAARIRRSYTEARQASDAMALMSGLGAVAVFAELGIHRLLARVHDVADLRDFAEEVLGELVEHERTNRSEYLTTLTVYFNENNSPQRTARRLHMHPNTVAYRVRRIEEITGLTLSSYADRLVMQVALEIVNGLGEAK